MNWRKAIEDQIQRHHQLNLSSPSHRSPHGFIEPTRVLIAQIRRNSLSEKEEQDAVVYCAKKALSSFFSVNQYYYFDQRNKIELEEIYRLLLADIKRKEMPADDFNTLAGRHYLRLRTWLLKSYPEVTVLFPPSQPIITRKVVCADYTAITQLAVLGISGLDIAGPVLDVGCGKQYHLIKYLRKHNLTAFGIDRDVPPEDGVVAADWFEFDFEPDSWGTIISHLAFTNHFVHHSLKPDGQHIVYAEKYIEILKSLIPGGRFYYAPDVPFMEQHLDPDQYAIQRLSIAQTPFRSVCVQRLQ